MRILNVSSGNLYGGVETCMAALATSRHLVPAQDFGFALSFEGALSAELTRHGCRPAILGNVRARCPLSVIRARKRLADVLTQRRPDAVICHMPWSQAVFGPVVRRRKIPLVFWMHDSVAGRHWVERWAALTPPDLVVCNSDFTASSLPKLYPRRTMPLEIVHAIASPPKLARVPHENRAKVRASLDAPEDRVVIIQVSRMEPYKGHLLHLDALARLRDMPDWCCWMVGGAQRPHERAYLDRLAERARAGGIGDRVRFLGHRDDVAELMAAADVFCQPNLRGEPFGLVFVEAMAQALPVVSTAIGGAREILDDTCARLVAPERPDLLAETLRDLIARPTLRRQLGRAGPDRANALSSPKSVLPGLVGALERAVSRSSDG